MEKQYLWIYFHEGEYEISTKRMAANFAMNASPEENIILIDGRHVANIIEIQTPYYDGIDPILLFKLDLIDDYHEEFEMDVEGNGKKVEKQVIELARKYSV